MIFSENRYTLFRIMLWRLGTGDRDTPSLARLWRFWLAGITPFTAGGPAEASHGQIGHLQARIKKDDQLRPGQCSGNVWLVPESVIV
jgi:hypothetical protein